MSVFDQITAPTSNVHATFLCARVSDSNTLIEKTEPSIWTTDFARILDGMLAPELFLDTTAGHFAGAEKHINYHMLKVYEDGVLLMFDRSINPANVMNGAIRMHIYFAQNVIRDAVRINIKIAVTNGSVKRFDAPAYVDEGEKTHHCFYYGIPITTAEKLCEEGGSRALFVDKKAILAGDMSLLHSSIAQTSRLLEGDQLLSGEKTVSVRGFALPVNFAEIMWDGNTHGVQAQPSVSGDVVKERPFAEGDAKATREFRNEPTRGRVVTMNKNKGFAFVEGDDQQRYFGHASEFTYWEEIKTGDSVFFYPRPPRREGENPNAVSIVLVGHEYIGEVSNILQKFCFVELEEEGKERYDVFYFFGDDELGLKRGDKVRFVLEENFNKKNQVYRPATRELRPAVDG